MKQYRLLNIGDSLRATDEWFNIVSFEWELIQNPILGKKLQNITAPIRREIILTELMQDESGKTLYTMADA